MYPIAFAENIAAHFGVPAGGLVTKVHTRFQHGLHGYVAHYNLLVGLHTQIREEDSPAVECPDL